MIAEITNILKKLFFSFVIIASSFYSSYAQTEYLVTVDPSSGVFNKVDSLPGVTWIATSPNYTTFDENANTFIFKGSKDNLNWRLFSVNAITGSVISNPTLSNSISNLQFGRSTNTLYGIGRQSNQLSLVSINPLTGASSIVSLIPGLDIADDVTFNNNSNEIIITGVDNTGKRYLYSINVINGSVTSKVPFINTLSIQFDDASKTLYGLNGSMDLVSINVSTGIIKKIKTIGAIYGMVSSCSTFDRNKEQYIFIGADNYLYCVDVKTGDVVSKSAAAVSSSYTADNVILHRYDNSLNKLFALYWEHYTPSFMPSTSIEIIHNSCNSFSFSFKSNLSGPTIKKWNFGDGIISTDSIIIHDYNTNADSVSVNFGIVRPGHVDTVFASQRVKLNKKPNTDFSYQQMGCLGKAIQFSVVSASAFKNMNWNLGNGSTDTQSVTTTSYTDTGIHRVTLIVNDSIGCSDTVTHPIKIVANPKVSAGKDKVVNSGAAVLLDGSVEGGSQFYWLPTVGLNSTSILQPTCITTIDRAYSLIVTDSNGCTSADTVKISVIKDLIIPNAFSPNGDGINDTWTVLNAGVYSDLEVNVFNRYGQLVYNSDYGKAWDGTYHGHALPPATYYFLITSRNKHMQYTGSVTILR